MDHSNAAKRRKLTPIELEKSFSPPSSTNTTTNSTEISTHGSSISHLPKELLSTIIDYIPKTQWPSLELVNRSFRDAVYSSWQSMKEFDMDKDVLDIRQSFISKRVRLPDFLPTILAKLLLRSPMLTSIIGFPSICNKETMTRYRSKILQIICQFANLKRFDFGTCGLKSVELVNFLTSSASQDRLLEINSSADYLKTTDQCPAIFSVIETSESQESRVKLEKLSLKNEYLFGVFLDPRIIDRIDPSSLTVLALDKIAAPSDYLLSLITNCNHLQQLQFSFMAHCPCKESPCVHSTSSKKILEAIAAMESLDSLKIGLICNWTPFVDQLYLDTKDDGLPILIDRLGRRGRLVEFGLLHKDYCSDEIITGIGDHLGALKSLELFKECCSTPTLINMIKNMISLEKLTLNFLGSDEITAVFNVMTTHLQNLRCLRLNCMIINIDCLNVLTSLECLEELTIVGGSYLQDHMEIGIRSSTPISRTSELQRRFRGFILEASTWVAQTRSCFITSFGQRFSYDPNDMSSTAGNQHVLFVWQHEGSCPSNH